MISDLILLLLLLLSHKLILRFFSYMPVLIFSVFLFQIGMIYLFIYSFSIIKFLICSSFIYVFFAWEFENSQKCNKKAVKLRDVGRERYQRVEDAP